VSSRCVVREVVTLQEYFYIGRRWLTMLFAFGGIVLVLMYEEYTRGNLQEKQVDPQVANKEVDGQGFAHST
jgi:hypothetical protein